MCSLKLTGERGRTHEIYSHMESGCGKRLTPEVVEALGVVGESAGPERPGPRAGTSRCRRGGVLQGASVTFVAEGSGKGPP